jgi:hypothetical protein
MTIIILPREYQQHLMRKCAFVATLCTRHMASPQLRDAESEPRRAKTKKRSGTAGCMPPPWRGYEKTIASSQTAQSREK